MRLTRIFAGLALAGLATSAAATNGYFSHGYGMKAKGMGGAATALAMDSFGGANNPASMAFAGDRIDLGADFFSPRREASRTGTGGFLDGTAKSGQNLFVIPEFGMSLQVSPTLAAGISVYGNGGLNTNYRGNTLDQGICMMMPPNGMPANILCGGGRLGVDLMQLVVAPTLAYKLTPDHAIGVSPLIGYQRFMARGLQALQGFSGDPANFTNRGYDDSFGYGVRIGYQGKLSPTVSVGAAYASKMRFEEFDKYRGLFAGAGDFDIPENYNLGIAVQATPDLLLAFDYQRINYSGVASVGNPSTNMAPLGAPNGPGFGWRDINVFKLGMEYKYSPTLSVRAGYNRGDNPIRARDVTFNILAPGVIKDHLTLGLTHTLASGNELTVSYMHAFENSVSGNSFLAGQERIQMYQNSLGIAYSWKL